MARSQVTGRIAVAVACALALSTCLLEGEVAYDGDYTFRPDTDLVDTNIYPLRHMLVVEDNAVDGRSLVYYFTGTLGDADLGFSDLRRLARDFNGFDMEFDRPRARYLEGIEARARALTDPDAGGEEAEKAEAGEAAAPLVLRLAGDALATLYPLDADALAPTGASRYLRTLSSSDYDVEAYAGVLPGSLPTEAVTLQASPLRVASTLPPSAPALVPDGTENEDGENDDDAGVAGQAGEEDGPPDTLTLQTEDLGAADYAIVELIQTIVPVDAEMPDDDAGMDEDQDEHQDEAMNTDAGPDAAVGAAGDAGMPDMREDPSQEALMRTELLPQTAYTVGQTLVTGAFGLGCWSLDEPMRVRVIQIQRRYVPHDEGDYAIIHHRLDERVVPEDVWQPLVQMPEPATYCEGFLE